MIRLLYDTFLATDPHNSGIPQDVRLLLKALAISPGIDASLLVHPGAYLPDAIKAMTTDSALGAALIINATTTRQRTTAPAPAASEPSVIRKLRWQLRRALAKRAVFSSVAIRNDDLFDAVWRTRLQASLSAADRDLLRSKQLVFSALPEDFINHSRKIRASLATEGFDFLVMQDVRVVNVSRHTSKIIRYHDSLPLLSPDTFPDFPWIKRHYYSLKYAAKDSFFVCNSESTREQLLYVVPQAESRSFVIPCTLPDLSAWQPSPLSVREIVRGRGAAISSSPPGQNKGGILLPDTLPRDDAVRYAIMVSTLEPRKNFPGAVSAFAEFLRRSRLDIKLLIVGRRGWNDEPILDAMAEGLRHGWIVHVENVPFAELMKLYQGAEALLFPSFGEGFGYPPMEAMQCGTPALVSDIAVHRWVMQDAVLYANPYDRNAIVDQLNNLLGPARSETLARLKAKWPSVLDRFSMSNVSQRWLELLQKLKVDNSSG